MIHKGIMDIYRGQGEVTESIKYESCMSLDTVADEDYVTVRLPKALTNEVDQLVDRRVLGYRSRAEFVAEAIRLRLEALRDRVRTRNGGR